MSTPRPSEEEIFEQAVRLRSPEERRAYLDRVCAGHDALRKDVELLLGCHRRAEEHNFLPAASDRPPTPGPPTAAPAPEAWEEPGTVIGRYRLLERIGEGGFGVVYLAEQREPVSRRVALKIIKLGMDTKAVVARFEAERQALAMMDHPHIARVFDAGATATGRPYFVMERVVGSRITDFCGHHRLGTRERVELFVKVCHAVQHAHQKGVIHRDLKPSNILVDHAGGPIALANPKVIDFGIAKATGLRPDDATVLTHEQMLVGTPAYMSPEQAEVGASNVDTRSDVYSLGVVLYELLTGLTPFDTRAALGQGIEALRKTIRELEPARPSTRLASSSAATTPSARNAGPAVRPDEVRGDLDWIVMKCLEKDRSRRYATVNGLAFDLQRFLRDEPVEARPPSTGYRFGKWVRRNRGTLAAAAAILLLLVSGAATSTVLAFRAVRAETAERELRRRAEDARETARLRAYVADMRSAGTALIANDLGRVDEFLRRYFPAPGESDLRGPEWRFLWHAARGQELRAFTLDRWINCARLSPDGSRLACALFGGEIRVLDAATGQVTASYPGSGEKYAHECLAYSPDGRWLASASALGVVVRAALDGSVAREWPGYAEAVGFSPDGKWFVRMDDEAAAFHDTADWSLRVRRPASVPGVGRVAFSPDGRRAVVVRRSLTELELVDLRNPDASRTLLHAQFPLSVAFAADGRHLAVGNSDGELLWYDLDAETLLHKEKAHSRYLFGLAISPDGTTLATGGGDQLIHLWDLPTGGAPDARRPARRTTLPGHRNEIWSVAFSADGRSLVSAGRDSSVRFWDLRGVEAGTPLRPWPPAGISLGFLADSTRYVRLEMDPQRIDIRSTSDHRVACSWPMELIGAAVVAGRRLASGTTNGHAEVRLLPEGTLERSRPLSPGPLRAVQLSLDGSRFLGWDRNAGKVALWDLTSGDELAAFPDFAVPEMSPSWSIPQRAAFSPDGRFLAYASSNFSVRVRDLAGRSADVVFAEHVWHVQTLRFSPDGRRLVSAGWDGVACIWDPATGRRTAPPLPHRTGIGSVAFSPDGGTLFTLGGDTQLHFWSVATGEESLAYPGGASWFANFAAPDGRMLAWDVGDGAVRAAFHPLPTLAEIDATRPSSRR